LIGEAPGQQLVDLIDWVLADMLEDVTQIRFRVQAIQLCRTDQTIESGSALTTGIGTSEEKISSVMHGRS